MPIGLYNSRRANIYQIDSWMIPLAKVIKNKLEQNIVDIDALLKYMIENDKTNCALFAATTWFKPKEGISFESYASYIARDKIISPFVENIDLAVFSTIVVSFIFDYFRPTTIDISEIVKNEIFTHPTNQYGLTKVNGATFKKDGLIFEGKGYYYNCFTNKTIINPLDSTVGFAKIIQDEAGDCDILYRLDDRLSMPEQEYQDYTGCLLYTSSGAIWLCPFITTKPTKALIRSVFLVWLCPVVFIGSKLHLDKELINC